MSCVMCCVSHVTCHIAGVNYYIFLFIKKIIDKIVKLVGGGCVINGATPPSFCPSCTSTFECTYKGTHKHKNIFESTYESTYKFGSAYKRTYKFGRIKKHKYKFGSVCG